MRLLVVLHSKELANHLADTLLVQKIENSILEDEPGSWQVWVHDDEDLSAAQSLLEQFQTNPTAPEFMQSPEQAKVIRLQKTKSERQARHRHVNLRGRWQMYHIKTGGLTLALIIISAGVALLSQLGSNREILKPLFIAEYEVFGGYMRWASGLPQVMEGQVWRLITPIFIHFGILHLVFNMLWLKDLGSLIEHYQGTAILASQVVLIAVLSNLGQYWMSGPSFGGMSGVVYGLLGFIWIRGKFDPASGLYLARPIVIWMVAWFVICLTGLVGNVANTAHGVGLVTGMIWGFVSAKVKHSP